MKYAFVAEHRPVFSVRLMCRCLGIHPSGFYAWLKEPLRGRAREDERQTKLMRQAWTDSGKVYGYRKLADDLRDQGEQISENRAARLASLAGSRRRWGIATVRAPMAGSQPSSPITFWAGDSMPPSPIRSG